MGAILLAWEGSRIAAHKNDARRLLLSRLVLEQRLRPQDPFGPSDPEREAETGRLLLDPEGAPLEEVRPLLT